MVAACLMLLAHSATATAMLSRGHVFSGTFEGTGKHTFGTPSGVAVNEANGIVYVADPAHERVELFTPAENGYEFAGELKVPDAGAIVVDNNPHSESEPSGGDVYVAGAEEKGSGEAEEEERDYLYKFTAPSEETPGKKVFKKKDFEVKEHKEVTGEAELERISGLAVDATGKLWIYWSEAGNINGFSNEEHNVLLPSLAKEEVLDQAPLAAGCRADAGFAVGPGDEVFYVAHERENGLGECPEEQEPRPEPLPTMVSKLAGSGVAEARNMDRGDATGVAVDARDRDVYVDNVDGVAAFGPEGAFIQRFGSGDLSDGGAVAVDSARGIVYVAEPGKVAVFSSEDTAAAPTIDRVSAQNLSPTSERVNAQIDPNGTKTTYRVQYGTVSCTEQESSCNDTPEQEVGEGFGDVAVYATLEGLEPNTTYFYRVIARNEHGTAVSPQSTQTFFTTLPSSEGVLLDHRQWQLVSPANMHGAVPESINPPQLGSLIQSSTDGGSLAWTASAPVSGQALGNHQPEPVQVVSTRGSEEWTSKEISTPHSKGEGTSTEEPTEYRFFSPDLSLAIVEPQFLNEPLENPPLASGVREKTIYRRNEDGEFQPLVTAENDETGAPFGGKLEFEGATANVKHVVFSSSEVPLVAGAGSCRNGLGEVNPGTCGLYEWEAGAPPKTPPKLISVLPGIGHAPASEPELGFNGFDVRGAISQDGSRIFWTSEGADGGLYMRDTATEETIHVNAAQGVEEAGPTELKNGLDEVHLQVASSDGSKVFFTDTWPLTGESLLEPSEEDTNHAADLYEYDVETGKLTDLTATANAELAEVLGTLPGASEDGSYVYFVANGVLAAGAEHGNCARSSPIRGGSSPEGKCNLYVSEPDPEHPGQRVTRFIARLSDEDANDWGEGNSPTVGDLGDVTAQVSSSGRYLAFMSNQDLTGYDNEDVTSEHPGERLDQEVYLYDASSGRLVCASCNPSGQRPRGVFDTRFAGEGEFLTVDRPATWAGQWLAGSIPGWTLNGYDPPRTEYQSRYLSNNGRLFFDSADALVDQDQAPTRQETVNGKTLNVGIENVYEYESDEVGSCHQDGGCVALISSGTSEHESAFLDASEDGGDVFFLTAAKLVAQDTEPGYKVYAAAECGVGETPQCLSEKPPPPEECTGEACRAPAGPQPGVQIPPTYTSSFAGNQVASSARPPAKTTGPPKPTKLTRAQKLAKALQACHKLKRKQQRRTCERKARKADAAKAKRTSRKIARRSVSAKGKER
jgi:DNA-binding beta-propeller fold protein YncE/Tol biopolymer transport system component